jgi:hypothetical protein
MQAKSRQIRAIRDDQWPICIAAALAVLGLLLVTGSMRAEDLSWSDRLIQELRSHDGVLAPTLPIHPVAGMYNREAPIPPQCYTRTEGRHNPCYVCHQNALPGRENTMNDGGLQLAYSFSEPGKTNHWQNLFEDRTARIRDITDEEALAWIGDDNFEELRPRLMSAGFKGWIPDISGLGAAAFAFDETGFAKDGSDWVAFNYKPLPSTFWPTNGSTDDVMIRLPDDYRQARDGRPSRTIYLANLSIAEAVIKGLDRIDTPELDEREAGEDLDGDGELGVVHMLPDVSTWVGKARGYYLQPALYPQGTEFLHTVRYVHVDAAGNVSPSRRMKEVRYMRKAFLMSPDAVRMGYLQEGYDKDEGLLPLYVNRGDEGLDNQLGWLIQSFIESADGRLRTATFEENMSCMGCHSSVGATVDKTFSFARKVDGACAGPGRSRRRDT